MRGRYKLIIAPFLTGLGVFVLSGLLAALFLSISLRSESERYAVKLVQRMDNMAIDALQILFNLNNRGLTQCDDVTRRVMQQQIFLSPYVIEIGFFENDRLVCTTGTGRLEKPIDTGEPDYVGPNNSEVYVRENMNLLLFDNYTMDAVLVRRGQFETVIDPTRMDILDVPYVQWQAVYDRGDKTLNLAGTKGVYDSVKAHPMRFGGSALVCSQSAKVEGMRINKNHCVAVLMDVKQMLSYRRHELVLYSLLTMILGFVSAVAVRINMTHRRSIRSRITKGLTQGSFYWLYQPIVDMQTGKVIGCEALARFQDMYGTLTPDRFIPMLREMQLTWTFTSRMIEYVLKDLDAQPLPDDFRVSLNIFPYDIERGAVARIRDIKGLKETRFKVCLEVTEDEYLDTPVAHKYLNALKNEGMALSVDDFGTGYSNLKTLTSMHFDYLKIDRSFVKDIETEGLKKSIIPQIMDIGQKYNLKIIAEGVETSDQHELLQKLGVHYGQGWRYGKPMLSIDLVGLINL
ncbi:EAL domain-containing protein [Teredinibacter sp. KSP-S5-2]|uniref:EAL domain-containing protein n=1 Tax=Teredinibacter sp. KSP-S5-2 TaxID=3034506 RepID=UPI0029353375|nr:EAL domain-containing protein [Teredinibacter sp. KSP-S5-2]WNO07805.1 EAL domain-containing protein [Teredinibacter sp. KSP-S5-2]